MTNLLKKLIEDEVVPVVKSLGFVKHGNTFVKEEDDFLKIIQLQSSQWNDLKAVSFTIECGIFFPDFYYKCFNELPVNPKIEHCLWQYRRRIGALKSKSDLWYELKVGEDNQAILDDIKNDLTWHVRRYFEQYTSLHSFFAPSRS